MPIRRPIGNVTDETVTNGAANQIGCQCAAQRIRQVSPSPRPPTNGVVQRARNHPGRVKRWIPVAAGGGPWWA